jgi:hypothetical protein
MPQIFFEILKRCKKVVRFEKLTEEGGEAIPPGRWKIQ